MIYRLCALLTTKANKKIMELIAMDINAFCDHIKIRKHLQTTYFILDLQHRKTKF